MIRRTATIAFALSGLALLIVCSALLSDVLRSAVPTAADAAAKARAVSLSDARYAPSMLDYVKPGHSTEPRQCAGDAFFSEFSAYRWNGDALGEQQWNRAHDRTYWRDARHGGRVTFDGVRFHNGTTRPVIVAGWCE